MISRHRLEVDGEAGPVDHLADRFDLAQRARDEALAAESGLTLITSTRSTSSKIVERLAGVCGVSTTPGRLPSDRALTHVWAPVLDKRPGVVLDPQTPAKALDYLLEEVDLVLVTSVNHGFGGQGFIPSSLRRSNRSAR